MKTFWILWNPEGQNPPTIRFATFDIAKEQAAKLQTRIGVGTMYVMRAVAGVTISLTQKWESEKSKS